MCPYPILPLLRNRSQYELDAARRFPVYTATRIREAPESLLLFYAKNHYESQKRRGGDVCLSPLSVFLWQVEVLALFADKRKIFLWTSERGFLSTIIYSYVIW
jgi:hypothetical protein